MVSVDMPLHPKAELKYEEIAFELTDLGYQITKDTFENGQKMWWMELAMSANN